MYKKFNVTADISCYIKEQKPFDIVTGFTVGSDGQYNGTRFFSNRSDSQDIGLCSNGRSILRIQWRTDGY